MAFALGQKSLGFLTGVHPVGLDVTNLAISISLVDFGATERQVRDLAYQRILVNRGVSQTMKSNHLEQVDLSGKTQNVYGHAEDLVPWTKDGWKWDWSLIYHIAAAMAEAARQKGVQDKICWGGVWDQWMSQYAGRGPMLGQNMADYLTVQAAVMRKAEADYCIRHPGKDFVDGPHFQFFKKG